MNDETLDRTLAQLADGELTSDEANDVLMEVLDDAARRERLKALLRLRKSLLAWRRQAPQAPVAALDAVHPPWRGRPRRAHEGLGLRIGSLAAAVVLGGLLVLAGFLAARREERRAPVAGLGTAEGRAWEPGAAPAAAFTVTPQVMNQVARVFALHESVAGPLKWYASDDQHVRMAAAEADEARGRPVAVLLRLVPATPEDGPPRDYVIVCRESEAATIELPEPRADRPRVRIHLVPLAHDGQVQVRYAIALSERDGGLEGPASLVGERKVGPDGAPLGQLALGDQLYSVGAGAWVMPAGAQP